MSSIETVFQRRPSDYQIPAGTSLTVPLEGQVDDVHVLHVGYPGDGEVTLPAGWTLVDTARTGELDIDIAEDIWLFPVTGTVPFEVEITFSVFAGEKWAGVHTVRYVDLTTLPSAVIGNYEPKAGG